MITIENITTETFTFISTLVGDIIFQPGEQKRLPNCWMPFEYLEEDEYYSDKDFYPHCGCNAFKLVVDKEIQIPTSLYEIMVEIEPKQDWEEFKESIDFLNPEDYQDEDLEDSDEDMDYDQEPEDYIL